MAANAPLISVIICTYNRDKFIGEALDSLSRQILPAEYFEIVIVNNNSTDWTESICKDFINAHPELQMSYVIEKQQGLSFARNRGLQEARASIITYIDDDAIAEPDFLEQIVNYLDQHPDVVGLGGKVIPRYEIEEPAWMNPYLHGFVTKVDLGETIKKYSGNLYPAGCNMTYRKAVLEQAGGFNNELKWRADDKYIFYEVKKISDQIHYLPKAKVQHHIDAFRTTHENFVNLSKRFGSEEKIRVKGLGSLAYFRKVIEFIFKFGGSILLAVPYALKGQFAKSRYLILYRYYALTGLL